MGTSDQTRKYLYKRKGWIGEGGMAVVLLYERVPIDAHGHPRTDEPPIPVAVKRIRSKFQNWPHYEALFDAECENVSYISSSNVVHIYDVGVIDNAKSIVMEWVKGCTLDDVIWYLVHRRMSGVMSKDTPWFSEQLCTFIVRNLLLGLKDIHTYKDKDGHLQCLVHRDVSPRNVLLSTDGEVKLADFGISKRGQASQFVTNGRPGTLAYMAPERLYSGKKQYDQSVDLYSVGTILFELLCQQCYVNWSPKPGLSHEDKHARIKDFLASQGSPAPELIGLTVKLLEPDPTKRLRSALTALDTIKNLPQAPFVRRELGELVQAATSEAKARREKDKLDREGQAPDQTDRTNIHPSELTHPAMVSGAMSTPASSESQAPATGMPARESRQVLADPTSSASNRTGRALPYLATTVTVVGIGWLGFTWLTPKAPEPEPKPSPTLAERDHIERQEPLSPDPQTSSWPRKQAQGPRLASIAAPVDSKPKDDAPTQEPPEEPPEKQGSQEAKPPDSEPPTPPPKPQPERGTQPKTPPTAPKEATPPDGSALRDTKAEAPNRPGKTLQAPPLRDLWCKGIQGPFEKHFAGRYPFNKSGRSSAKLAAIKAYFHPRHGSLWKQVRALAPYVERRGNTFISPRSTAANQGLLSRGSLFFLKQAWVFANSLFPDGQEQVALRFELTLLEGQNLEQAKLRVGAKLLDATRGPSTFVWPKNTGKHAELQAISKQPTGESNKFHLSGGQGPWSFLRLLEKGQVLSDGYGRIRLSWTDPKQPQASALADIRVLGSNPLIFGPSFAPSGFLRVLRVRAPQRPFLNLAPCKPGL